MNKVRWMFLLALSTCLLFQSRQAIALAKAQPKPPEKPGLSELIPPDKLKEDLDFLFKTIEEVHPNMYAYVTKERFAVHRDGLSKEIDRPMTRLQFYKKVAPVVAKLKSGHTFVYPFLAEFKRHLEGGGKIYPISLRFDGDNVILAKTFGHDELPIGGTVCQINGQDARSIMGRYATYFAAECRNMNPSILGQDKTLWCLFWLEFGQEEPLNLTVRATDGTMKKCAVKATTFEQAMATKPQSASVKEDPYTYRALPEARAALIEIRSFRDTDRFHEFLRETFEEIKEQAFGNLIVDVRDNPGGNSNVAKALLEFLTGKPIREFDEFGIKFSKQYCEANQGVLEQFRKALPEKNLKVGSFVKLSCKEWPAAPVEENPLRFDGRTFVLIGPRTASTSVMFASAIRGLGIGTLVGSETMDTTSLYGECFKITLPNTGLQASVACKFFLLVGGRDDGRGLLPDYDVKETAEDTAKDLDTVLQFTLDLIKKG